MTALLAIVSTTAQARDHNIYLHLNQQPWYMDHGGPSRPEVTRYGGEPTQEEVDKAIRQQRECLPVVVHMDDRTIVHPASECRR